MASMSLEIKKTNASWKPFVVGLLSTAALVVLWNLAVTVYSVVIYQDASDKPMVFYLWFLVATGICLPLATTNSIITHFVLKRLVQILTILRSTLAISFVLAVAGIHYLYAIESNLVVWIAILFVPPSIAGQLVFVELSRPRR